MPTSYFFCFDNDSNRALLEMLSNLAFYIPHFIIAFVPKLCIITRQFYYIIGENICSQKKKSKIYIIP